jgi:tetratricopeptide (TPR) repeat protein
MTALLVFLLLQSPLVLPPRTAMENPAAVSPVPAKLQKDYGKMWMRFLSGNDDAKLEKDLDRFLKKQKSFDPALTLEGYIALYKGDDTAARQKFTQAFSANSNNRIAVWYLAEMAFARKEYATASTLYTQLLAIDTTRSEIETKRQRSLLLATDNMLQSAATAEGANRLAEAEQYYRQALGILPNDPTLHARLADLLVRENKKDEGDAERKVAEGLLPLRPATVRAINDGKTDSLDDLGRWGNQIELFHQIRDAEIVTREQISALIVRYFPQVMELRQTPQIVTDIQDSWARPEIQTVVGVGLIDLRPNHTFEPEAPIQRGELAVAAARLIRLLGVSPVSTSPISAPDLAPTNAQYLEVGLVLGLGVMTLQDSGSFNVSGDISGQEAVLIGERLLRTFQQAQH